jgi:Domain of unknown function (DUF6484)
MGRRTTIPEERSVMEEASAMLEAVPPMQAGALASLLHQRAVHVRSSPLPEVVVGELIALTNDGHTPLVHLPAQPGGTALPARSIVDLQAGHVGRDVVLSFEGGDPALPIVMGVLTCAKDLAPELSGHVEVNADGKRMIVAADEQLVLRCGKASITLTKAGKVLIEGTYVSSKSTGSNRIKGGSIQLN